MYQSNNEIIKNQLEIFNLLKKIQKSKQLISVSFKSLPQCSLTSLLDVQHDKNSLVFDEPYPLLPVKIAKVKDEIKFSLKLEKLPVNFTTKLPENAISNANLIVPFPKEIYYPQNRSYYRFRTEFIEDINSTIYFSETNKLSGKLVNISLNGLCIRLPYSFASMFQVSQLIEDIYIELPEQNGFSISAKVQNARVGNSYTNIDLGLQIHQQKTSTEKTIQQFIFRTENN